MKLDGESHYLDPTKEFATMLEPNMSGRLLSEPNLLGQLVTEPNVLGPLVSQPNVLGPLVSQPHMLGPLVSQPHMLGQLATEPNVLGPLVSQPHVLGPLVSQPYVLGPLVSKPNELGQLVTEPHVLGPLVSEPNVLGPLLSEPHLLGPHLSEPNVLVPPVKELHSACNPKGGRSCTLNYENVKPGSFNSETLSQLDTTNSSKIPSCYDNYGQRTNKIQCSVCEEKYDNMTEYTHHLSMHLEDSALPQDDITTCPMQPDKCPKTFDNENMLFSQEQDHSKYECSERSSPTSESLHTTETPFSCPQKQNHDARIIGTYKIREAYYKSKSHTLSQCKSVDIGPTVHNIQEITGLKDWFCHKCVMCLEWFYTAELEKHLWECKAKLPCLSRIVEMKTELKEDHLSQDDNNQFKTAFPPQQQKMSKSGVTANSLLPKSARPGARRLQEISRKQQEIRNQRRTHLIEIGLVAKPEFGRPKKVKYATRGRPPRHSINEILRLIRPDDDLTFPSEAWTRIASDLGLNEPKTSKEKSRQFKHRLYQIYKANTG